MREIKFRAWDSQFNNWVDPDDMRMNCATGEVHGKFSCGNVPTWNPEQFTGLLDKNGKEIYEGDIISGSDGANLHNIAYCNNEARFLACYIPAVEHSDGCSLKVEWIALCGKVVIGNIHENPELLEKS